MVEEIKEAPVPNIGQDVLFEFNGSWLPAKVTRIARIDYYQHLPKHRMGVYVDLEVHLPHTLHPQIEVQEGEPLVIVFPVKGAGWSDNLDHVGMWRLP